ncbi:hypothetical protein QH494_27395 [Sphingomonas sp. AR_OL41]|uniref:hypothetical protein n=1 Tax=Sphingomonas sp. AR_OL41 TaxID=3042729 RepID=UPI002480A0FE|nr:hypothetical protein [Sphingomonas sp. AR_OL41]MDH7975921.1 hypothetical protein [Sphingomonas sp. AR_OL41]
MSDADYNIAFENVRTSDGSLSNFAILHGLPYMNFETRDRGNNDSQLVDARQRLAAMIEAVVDHCRVLLERPDLVAAKAAAPFSTKTAGLVATPASTGSTLNPTHPRRLRFCPLDSASKPMSEYRPSRGRSA